MAKIHKKRLGKVYYGMYNKLRSIQVETKFDELIKDRRNRSFKGKSDNWFFEEMAKCIFGFHVRGKIVMDRRPAIEQAFSRFNVNKVAKYTQEDVDRLVGNPDIRLGGFLFKRRVEACAVNAQQIMKISSKYGSFEKYIDRVYCARAHDDESLKQDFKKKFRLIGGQALVLDYLNQIGVKNYLKPSVDAKRIFSRLGFIENERQPLTAETINRIQQVGQAMAMAVNERLFVIDGVIWLYSSGNPQYVSKAICGKKPKCNECNLTRYCVYNKSDLNEN